MVLSKRLDIEVINKAHVRHHFKLELEIIVPDYADPHLSILPILNAEYLVKLSICGSVTSLYDIDRLGEMPDLRMVRFGFCVIKRAEIMKLYKNLGGLKFISYMECIIWEIDDSLTEDYEITWDSLT